MGNVLFLVGITLLLGPQRTFAFFARRQKWRGSSAFWAGIVLILMRWTFVGFAVECVGIFYLFGEFFKVGDCCFCLVFEEHMEVHSRVGGAQLCFRGQVTREIFANCCMMLQTLASFAYNIPIIGPYLARGLQVAGDKAGANDRAHKDLPV